MPITIQQQAAGQGELPTSALQASEPEPVLALIESSHWPQQGNNKLPNATTRTGGLDDLHLVQLQLPLQLHLKLKPLPLPMPPPTARSSSLADNQLSAEKRKRSLEAQAAVTTTATTTTTQDPNHKKRLERERRELMALTWREAKRILLLSSMSPALLQKRLERRIAELPESSNETVESGAKSSMLVGDFASPKAPYVDATTTAASGLLQMRQQTELEHPTSTSSSTSSSTSTDAPKTTTTTGATTRTTTLTSQLTDLERQSWKPVQQPPTAEPLLPTTTYKSNQDSSNSNSNPNSKTSADKLNPSSLSWSEPSSVLLAQTTPLPPTTTTTAAALTTAKGEVRRQRHSSQVSISAPSFSFFFLLSFSISVSTHVSDSKHTFKEALWLFRDE